MRKVEVPAPNLTPGVANLEDMTQPMGPLEEGDQALVDVVQGLPEGEHLVYDKLGGITGVNKSKSLGHAEAKLAAYSGGGGYENIDVTIDTVPEDGIKLQTFDRNTDGDSSIQISGNSVRFSSGERYPDREAAQAIKREAADRLNAVAEQLGHGAVKAAQR